MISTFDDLIAFLHRFHRSLSDSPGLATVPGDLPDGLARIYREFGSLIEMPDGPFHGQDHLFAAKHLRREDGMILFAMENQGNWSCRCPSGPGDPPVYSDADDLWSGERRGFVEVCASLNRFLTTLCLQEAVFGCRNVFSGTGDSPLEGIPGLEPLWLGGKYVFEQPTHDFFAGGVILVLRHANEGTFVGSPTISDPREIRRVTGLDASRLN